MNVYVYCVFSHEVIFYKKGVIFYNTSINLR